MTATAAQPVNDLLDAALEYRAQGRPIFAVCWTEPHQHTVNGKHVDCEEKNRGKTPLVPWKEFQTRVPTEREVRKMWRRWPQANIGMATGACSGIVVGDLDGELAQVRADQYGYAEGPYVLTGRPGGRHLFFAWRADAPHNFAKREGIDFRGEGGYVVLPPSRHVLGTMYRWGQPIVDVAALPRLPEWFDLLAGNIEGGPRYATAETVGETIGDHERNTTLTSLGGTMRRRGMSESEIAAALHVVNQERCQPPLSDAEVGKIAHSVARYAPEKAPDQPQTERQQASARLVEEFNRPRAELPTHWTARELMDAVIDPPREIVPGLLYEGLGVFAARPKFGKSWIAFDVSIAISDGTQALHAIPCRSGDVLYYALEDGPSRLQSRLYSLLGDEAVPSRLEISTKLDRLDEGGLVDIAEWLQQHPAASLVIVDTWKRVQPRLKRGQDMDLYGAEYDAANTLKALADRHHVAIWLIHHTRKPFKGGSAQDFLDEVLGTSGLTGAADAIMVARRERNSNDGVLYVTGRDVPETARALTWDDAGHWTIGGDAETARRSTERAALIAALEEMGTWLTPSELALHFEGKSVNAVKLLAWKAGRDGDVQGDGYGRYAALGVAQPANPGPSRARTREGKFGKPGNRGDDSTPEQDNTEIESEPVATVSNVSEKRKPRRNRGAAGNRGADTHNAPSTVSLDNHGFPSVSRESLTQETVVTQSQSTPENMPETIHGFPVSSNPVTRARTRTRAKAKNAKPEWTGKVRIP